jgi:cell division protein FtsW
MIETQVDIPIQQNEPSEPEPTAMAGWAAMGCEAWLWVLVLALAAMGTIMVYSASSVIALRRFSDPYFFLKKQIVVVAIGVLMLGLFSRIPYRFYEHLAKLGLLAAIGAMALVWMPHYGIELNGARRWFRIGSLHVQPSEYAKVAWIIYLSTYCSRKQERIRELKSGLMPPMLLLGVMILLLAIEPDFGTTVILAVLTLLLLLAAGARWSHFLLLSLPAAAGFYQLIYRSPYRWQRITTFWDPWVSPLSSGYQLIQSWIAVGSGGLMGKGLGAGHQKLFYLPEPFTDFILAVIGEELGWIGITLVVVLFAALILVGITIARTAPDALGSYLAFGLTSLIFVESFMNMGVVLGLLPTKGLALPLVSYGGSSFTANCIAAGILINVARSTEKVT